MPAQTRKKCDPDADINLSDSCWYLNRELTWLEFNRRVLHEAEDERTPLLERLKFIAIVSANLDEFFMKRIGGLKQQVAAGLRELTLDGLTPLQQIVACHSFIRPLENSKHLLLQQVLARLAEQGIIISAMKDLSARERKSLRNHFATNIYPLLDPAVDRSRPPVPIHLQPVAQSAGNPEQPCRTRYAAGSRQGAGRRRAPPALFRCRARKSGSCALKTSS